MVCGCGPGRQADAITLRSAGEDAVDNFWLTNQTGILVKVDQLIEPAELFGGLAECYRRRRHKASC